MKIKHHIFSICHAEQPQISKPLFLSCTASAAAEQLNSITSNHIEFFLTAAHLQPLPSADVKCLLVEAMIAATVSPAV